jgi:hypothetical protein
MKKGLNLLPWASVRKRTIRSTNSRGVGKSFGAMTSLNPCALSANKQIVEVTQIYTIHSNRYQTSLRVVKR